MATHSSILAWRIPQTEEPGGLQSMGLQRVRHDWMTFTLTDEGGLVRAAQLPSVTPPTSPEWWTDKKHSYLSILIWYQQAQCQTFLFYSVGRWGEEERTSKRIHRLNPHQQRWGLPPQWDSTALRQLTSTATSTDVHVPSTETGHSRFYNICTKERETSADLVW